MQELSTKYDPSAIEHKWYQFWMDRGLFRSVPDDRPPYTIVIPPPNVTGVLHMGHMLNNTLQDVLVRRARMRGFNACWVPGTDHASIATEAKVVEKLGKEGIKKSDLTREEFLEHSWAWKEKHGGIILEQLKRLGASCDWDRTAFTMDPERSASVIKVFVELYRKGLIYKGARMVNWDPEAKTALSDEEVTRKDTPGRLYYLRYPIVDSEEYFVVATTRPETIMGDVAICLNPEDPRFEKLKDKEAIVPLVGRRVKFIADEYVDKEFGTGALKITPAHDINDYNIGQKHHLETIDTLEDDGTISECIREEIEKINGPHKDTILSYIGLDRFEVRKRIAKALEEAGLLEKYEDYKHNVGYSERTNAVIEPKISTQWFLKMKGLAKPALKAVLEDEVELIPRKFVGTYRHWMENVQDWCISRQLWWGHRIPAWYLPDGQLVVAENEEEALLEARRICGDKGLKADQLRQDEDVLDTWFSSWLWPISVFNGIMEPDNPDINYYYPTNDIVTAPEILFFWIARMIIAGYEFRGERPFQHVYLTGIVRDKQRIKMSKSLGNSPDPIKLMEEYGADGVRVGMMLCSSAGNDLLFDESHTEQGRNFCNKVWNAFRLVHGWESENAPQSGERKQAMALFKARLSQASRIVDEQMEQYRISEALLELYRLFWDDFSSWLLEALKPIQGKRIDSTSKQEVVECFETMLVMLHPFMPFITEELWHNLDPNRGEKSIMVEQIPDLSAKEDPELLKEYEQMKSIVSQVRAIRQSKGISPKETLKLLYRDTISLSEGSIAVIKALANVESVESCHEAPQDAASFLVDKFEFFIPLEGMVNAEEEREKLEKELEYHLGFKAIVEKKLSNEKFVQNAPAAVVEAERKKLTDAEAKIAALQRQLKG